MAYNPLPFQQDAIDKLVEIFKKLWNNAPQMPTKELVFKSPTGSGKTFMMTHFVNSLNSQPDWQEDVAWVWITFSDDLAMQSRDKYAEYLAPNVGRNLLTVADLKNGVLQRNDILFLNWQKLVSNAAENRVLRRPDDERLYKEMGFYFEDVVERTHAAGRTVVMIIDESHKNVTAAAMRDVINPLQPRIIIKVSATLEKTPSQDDCDDNKAGYIRVKREDVVEAGLIKREIISQTEDDLNLYEQKDHDILLLDLAIEKRRQVANEWKRIGQNINPLVLIQLPNDEKKLKETNVKSKETIVTEYLTSQGIPKSKIAYWFDNRKENMDDITRPDCEVEYMLFKYAAGTGWDCPRAHILVMYREIQSTTFKTQTLGRIFRNPLPGNPLNDYPLLHTGYLFTNYQRNEVQAADFKGSYAPKTIISGIQTQIKIEFAAKTIAEEIKNEVEQRIEEKTGQKIEENTIQNQQFEAAIQSIEQKTKEVAREINIINKNENDETKRDQKIEEKKEELLSHTQLQLTFIEDETIKKSVFQHTQTQVENLTETVVKQKDTQFVLDPCLKTDYISKVHSGDLGKSSELQKSLRNSLNDYFGFTLIDIDNIEKICEKFRNAGVDPKLSLEQFVLVNARFKSDMDDSENELGKNIRFEMSNNDVEKEFALKCYDLLGENKIPNVARAFPQFKEALRQWANQFSDAFDYMKFYKIFLNDIHKEANSVFRIALQKALADYKPALEEFHAAQKEKAEKENLTPFVIKTRYAYTDDAKAYECNLSIVNPFRLPKKYSGRDNETAFISHLESQYETIDWWFKNGDSGQDYLGFKYVDSQSNKTRLFYPDWIVKYKDGRIGIFDTKGGITAKSAETKDKAEALQKRLEILNRESNLYQYFGGIVVKKENLWYLNNNTEYLYTDTLEGWIVL